MAVKKVHSFRRIQSDIKENDIKNVLFFYGREHYLVRWSIEQIKSRYINPAVEMFDFVRIDWAQRSETSDSQAASVIEACETMPMMSEKRVVLVEDFDMTGEGLDELAAYLENFPESTVLILSGKGADKRKKIFKAIQKYGAEYEFDQLELPELKSFITKRLRASGKKFSADVPGLLAEASGYYGRDSEYTIDNMINDIDKVISHSGEYISADDVEETVSGSVERDVFAFSDALAAGRKGEALRMLGVLLNYGENVFKLLGLICSQFETVLLVREMREDGMSMPQMKETLGIHEFRIKKSMSLATKYTTARLRQILMKAYEVDRNIKSGLSEPETALELLVAGV